MAEKEYVCGYSHCLHHGQKVKESEAVVIGKKKYHWDCAMTKMQIDDIKTFYIEKIDNEVSVPVLMKVLNDLVFKYELDIDFILWSLKYYADTRVRINSPFTLLYLRDNETMKRRWERSKVLGEIE